MNEDGLSEEPGEGYFASVSDLMVGVLFVFLLMMTVFALNFRDDSARLDRLIAQAAESVRLKHQNELLRARLAEAATALEHELRDREQVRARLLDELATQLQAQGIRFALDQQSGVLRLSDSIPFATGRSDLADPIAQHTVSVLAQVLATILPCFSTASDHSGCAAGDGAILETMLVEGHTDSQPFPDMTPVQSEAENDRLSTARALTVFAAIRQQQPSLDGLRNPADQPLLGVSGYGQRRPLPGTGSAAEADLTRNRRIDLRFVLSARTSEALQGLLDRIERLQQDQPP